MKKLISLVTVLVLLVAFAAPVSAAMDDEAYTLYRTYLWNMERVESMGIKGSMEFTMSVEDITLPIAIDFDCHAIIQDDDSVDMRAYVSALGSDDEIFYVKGDYMYYINENGKKVKSKMGLMDLMSMLPDTSDTVITQADFEDAVVTNLDDGGIRIQYTLEGNPVADLTNSLYDAMELDAELEYPGDIQCTVVIDANGYLKSMKMTAAASIEVEDIAVSVEYNVNMSLYSINRIREIGFPTDLNLYVETAPLF